MQIDGDYTSWNYKISYTQRFGDYKAYPWSKMDLCTDIEYINQRFETMWWQS